MSYFFAKTLEAGFDEAVARPPQALKAQGFGVLTEIDVAQTLKTKIGVDFRPYLILGACNPKLAHEALSAEPNIGLMLPCNVVLQDAGGGKTEISAIDPVASMAAVDNARLREAAAQVQGLLRKAIEAI